MANNSSSNPLAALRQSIEALALEVALRDLSSQEKIQPLKPMLAQIRRHAESAGMAAVTEAASLTVATEPDLRDIVTRLQQLVVEAERPAAPSPPPPASLNHDPELVADFIIESREHHSARE